MNKMKETTLGITTLAYDVTYKLAFIEELDRQIAQDIIDMISPACTLNLDPQEKEVIQTSLQALQKIIEQGDGITKNNIDNINKETRNEIYTQFRKLLQYDK